MQRLILFILAFLATVPVMSQTGRAQQLPTPQTDMHAKWKSWRETIKKTPKPNEKGCFKASYPDTEWQETPCKTAPLGPYPPKTGAKRQTLSGIGGLRPNTIGFRNADDVAAVSGTLSSATGTFPTVSGLTSATAYSLQLNANTFTTSVCSGAAIPSECQGWVQFVYSSSPSVAFIEYWLLNWGTTCPTGWTVNPVGSSPPTNCYKNSSATDATVPQLSNWSYLELVGKAASGTDEVTFYDGAGNVSSTAADSLVNLESSWDEAEFNVFGNGNGSGVTFNSGTTFGVQTSVVNGTTTAPVCEATTFTAETNNLSLVGTCCPYSGSTYLSPNIQFLESNNSIATASCGASQIQTNIVATPNSSGTYISSGGEYPTITFTETLTDSTPGAQINWQVSGCSGSTSGSDPVSSGGTFTLTYNSEYDCNPSGTMYATKPGYIASPVTSIDFP
jgi:hypothetical protein